MWHCLVLMGVSGHYLTHFEQHKGKEVTDGSFSHFTRSRSQRLALINSPISPPIPLSSRKFTMTRSAFPWSPPEFGWGSQHDEFGHEEQQPTHFELVPVGQGRNTINRKAQPPAKTPQFQDARAFGKAFGLVARVRSTTQGMKRCVLGQRQGCERCQ
jgi:hypothetical protein